MTPDNAGPDAPEAMAGWRWNGALFLISLAMVVLELALMRILAERFWQHFAHMVISVAMLGCGISGILLSHGSPVHRLLRGLAPHLPAMGFAFVIPCAALASELVPLNPMYLAWDITQGAHVLLLEFFTLLPFVAGSTATAHGLMQSPGCTGGAYAASLFGAGAGAIAGIALLFRLSPMAVLVAASLAAFLGGLLLMWQIPTGRGGSVAIVCACAIPAMLVLSREPAMSEYKALPAFLHMPGTVSLHSTRTPLGRIDVVRGPSIHLAPGLELGFRGRIPAHAALLVDGDQPSAVYDCRNDGDRAFLSRLTSAAAYSLLDRPDVLIVGAGGGSDIQQAIYHKAGSVCALEMDAGVIGAMRGPLKDAGGGIFDAPGVAVVNCEARRFLATSSDTWDLIQMSLVDAFGIAGAGLRAGQEAWLFTVESFEDMLRRLKRGGVISVTRWAEVPPRDSLKILDTMATALRKNGSDPARHLVMIRNWATVTVLCFGRPPAGSMLEAVKVFCRERRFDIDWLAGDPAFEPNRYHLLEHPVHNEGATALLGRNRKKYIDQYPFWISATTDDRPFFYQFLKWAGLRELSARMGNRARSYVELGSLLLILAVVQTMVLTVVFLLVPLLALREARDSLVGAAPVTIYFAAIGAGYMALEMGFMQKLVLFLGHPVYSAAAVIAGFLVFSGIGSQMSDRGIPARRETAMMAAGCVAGMAVMYPGMLDEILRVCGRFPDGARFLTVVAGVAPLAFPMGFLFPLGFGLLKLRKPEWVSWAWGMNGFASVLATVGAPLAAMQTGFGGLFLIAAACYATACLCWYLRLGLPPEPAVGEAETLEAGRA